jgi:hypothetical protein
VQRRDGVLARPFAFERARIVHYVAQTEDQRGPAPAQQVKGGTHLAAQAERLLVNDQDVGVEDLGRVANNRGAHRQRLFDIDMQAERDILAVAQLDNARYAHEIDARAEIEAADDRRAR